jgi:predicted N-acetyltransferase YhbS
MDAMNISSYEKNNIQEITQMFIITFSDSKGAKEGNNIGELVLDLLSNTNESDFYCFIATENKKIIGSIICSRLSFETLENVFMLATVAVDTAFQRKGIGQKLIHF